MRLRTGYAVASGVVLGAVLAVGCADEVDDGDGWELDESLDDWEWMEGPPGSALGLIAETDQRLYLQVGSNRFDGKESPVGVYTPGEGWELDRELGEILGRQVHRSGPPVVELHDDYYTIGEDAVLYRSDDGVGNWERLEELPVDDDSPRLESDGQALFTAEMDEELTLWRREADEQSWQAIAAGPPGGGAQLGETAAEEGLIVADFDTPEFSTDSGQTWQSVSQECPNFPNSSWWFQFRGDHYFVEVNSPGSHVVRLDDGDCQRFELPLIGERLHGEQPPTEEDMVEPHAFGQVGDRLVGISQAGWGIVNDDLSGWEDVEEFPEVYPGVTSGGATSYPSTGIVELPDEQIGFALRDGLWAAGLDGENWVEITHDWSSPQWALEHRGELLSGARPMYGIQLDERQWEPDAFELPEQQQQWSQWRLMRRDGDVFAQPGPMTPLVARIDEGEIAESWSPASDEQQLLPFRDYRDIQVGEQGIFIGATASVLGGGTQGEQDTPPGDSGEQPGGGVFLIESLEDDDPELFGEGFPRRDDDLRAGVRSMELFGGELWVATDDRGVWVADLEDGQWTRAGDELPGDDDPIQGIEVVDGELFAYSAGEVFVHDGVRFERLVDEPFEVREHEGQSPLGDSDPVGVRDLVGYNETLLVAHLDGVYELNRSTGQRRQVWQPEHGTIQFATVEESGLYLGVRNGGVWRYRVE